MYRSVFGSLAPAEIRLTRLTLISSRPQSQSQPSSSSSSAVNKSKALAISSTERERPERQSGSCSCLKTSPPDNWPNREEHTVLGILSKFAAFLAKTLIMLLLLLLLFCFFGLVLVLDYLHTVIPPPKKATAKKATTRKDRNDELSWPVGENEKVLLECNCTCFVSDADEALAVPSDNATNSVGSAVSNGTRGRVRLAQKKSGDRKISIIVREDNKTGRILLFHRTPTRIDRMATQIDPLFLYDKEFALTFDNSDVAEKIKKAFERAQNLGLLELIYKSPVVVQLRSTAQLQVVGATAIYRGRDSIHTCESRLRAEVAALANEVTAVKNENATLQNENADLKKKVAAVQNENADLKNKLAGLEKQELQTCVVCWENTRSVLFRPCNHACVCVDCEEGFGENLLRECPLCKGVVEAKERVYIF